MCEIQEILDFIQNHEYPYPEEPISLEKPNYITRFPTISKTETKEGKVIQSDLYTGYIYHLTEKDEDYYEHIHPEEAHTDFFLYTRGLGNTLLESLQNLKQNLIEHTKELKERGYFYQKEEE